MTLQRTRMVASALLVLLVTAGCKAILDPEQYIREDDAGMDGGAGTGGTDGAVDGSTGGTDGGTVEMCEPACEGLDVCQDGVCVTCDADDDEWLDARSACDPLADAGEARDCDDDDPDVHPFAPAECGNGVVDNCQTVPQAWQELGVQELVSFFDNSEETAGVTTARQLSVAPRRSGEPGAWITLMEEGRPILRTASLSDGNALSLDDRTDLADGTDATSIQSVAVQKLAGSDEAMLAFVGRTSVAGTGVAEQATLWYARMTDSAPSPSSILVPASDCAGARSAAPRLAIAGGAEPRMIWLQGLMQSGDPRMFASYGPQDEFRCHDTPMADGLQHIGSSTGPFVASAEASNPDGPRFWDGSDVPPQLLTLDGVSGRSDLVALPDGLHALYYAGADRVGAELLQCTPAESPLCTTQRFWRYDLSDSRGALAAAEALERGGAVTAHVERRGEGDDQFDDLLIDALGAEGELVTDGDARWPYSVLFVTAPRTLVDLDVGATFDEERGLLVYVAALTADQADAEGFAPAGDELLLGGVRGCMDP